MSSWVSHFRHGLAVWSDSGINPTELAANPMLTEWVVHDLNADPTLPFPDAASTTRRAAYRWTT